MGPLEIFELATLMLLALVALGKPDLCSAWFSSFARRVQPILSGTSAILLVAFVSLVINAGIGLFILMPVPAVHDEFAYLLGADTFANGRITNPTHPMWEHFQSYHIIQHPTYQSKYPPAQSLALAAGQILFGHPIAGVWVSLAAACAAVCWMLQAWVPPRWATLGGLLIAVNPRMIEWWGQTYYGGAVAMLGGALVFGSLRRLVREYRVGSSIALAIGLIILANSRPYEGLLASIPSAVVLTANAWRHRKQTPQFFAKVLLPMTVMLMIGFGGMAQYNHRVSGNAMQLPYQVWLRQNGIKAGNAVIGKSSSFVNSELHFSPIASSAANDAKLDWLLVPHAASPGVLDGAQKRMEAFRTSRRTLEFALFKLVRQYFFYFSFSLGLPVASMLPFILRQKWMRWALATAAIVTVSIVFHGAVGNPHYIAPVAPLFALLSTQALRHLRAGPRRYRERSRGFVRVILLVSFALVGVYLVSGELFRNSVPLGNYRPFHSWSLSRAMMKERLSEEASKQIVIVRYFPQHNWYEEWVYNPADIDGSRVIWARDLGDRRNARLLRYFADRQAWLLEPDGETRSLRPYRPIRQSR